MIKRTILRLTVSLLLLVAVSSVYADTEKYQTGRIETRAGEIETFLGVPARGDATAALYDELDYASALSAYVWAMPVVNLAGYFDAWRNVFNAEWGQYVALPSAQDRRGNLTPTTSSTYVLAMADLSETGPLVIIDIPGKNAGIIIDLWQRLLGENGIPGPFKGQGGKILVIGPGQEEPADADGYHIVRSPTYHVWWGTRLLDSDKKKALSEQGLLLQAYPYSQRKNPPQKDLIIANERKWSQNPPSGLAYFDRLARYILKEPVEERDRFMMAQLRTLGIEHDKPFDPNDRQTRVLTEGAEMGELILRAATAERRATEPYWEGTHWKELFVYPASQREDNFDHYEERAILYWEIFGIGITTTSPGTGSKYTVTHQDENGDLLDGGRNYRLHIPPNVPAKLFWSVCAYDEWTRTFIEGTDVVMIGSQEPVYETNADGSIDVYFGPEPPKGKEKNWVETTPGRVWFSYFRFFGPTEPFLEKTWKLPDFEPID